MKNILIFAAIAVLVLSACSSRSGRRNKTVEKVKELKIDSCQYDMWSKILYFAAGDTAVRRSDLFIDIYGVDTVTSHPDIKTIRDILDKKWPVPELYSSVSLRHFKRMIATTPLDSSFVKKLESRDVYCFYLSSYKISITLHGFVPFENKGEILISTRDIYGECVLEFGSSSLTKWSQKQQQEILSILLTKKEKQESVVSKKNPGFICLKKYEKSLKKEISDRVMKELSK